MVVFMVSCGADSFILVHSFTDINETEAPVSISLVTSVSAIHTVQM